jgi:TonB family protein
MPAEFKAALERSKRIKELLLRGEWAPAEAEARAGLAADVEHTVEDPAKLLAFLAVAEERQSRYDDAAWHWQEVQAMTETADPSSFGVPGEVALAKIPVRRLDEAPAGLAVRKEGDGGPPLTPARRVSGEEAKLPGSQRIIPLGIRVQVIIDAEGRVRQPVVAASTSPILTYVVLEAMRGWRFTPAEAGGQPVASFYELKFPPVRPLERVLDFSKSDLAEPAQLLKAGRYAEAETKVDLLWRHALLERQNDQTAGFFGLVMIEKALAEAGLGREDGAICRYHAAQALEPRLYGADLWAFGAAGALLMRHPWRSEYRHVLHVTPHSGVTPPLSQAAATNEVKRPELISHRSPEYPAYAQRTHLFGTVIAEAVISERGIPLGLSLLKPGPTTGFDASALDALCDWRYKPATWKGQPINVYYSLTVNFEVRLH